MKETERIADQLKLAFHGDAWHGPSVKEALSGVTAEVAAQRPIANAHTVWEIIHHITAWMDITRRRLQGEQVQVTPEMDWPPVTNVTAAGWTESVKHMEKAQSELRKTVLQIPESRLDEPAFTSGDPIYVLLHGIVQHSLYHTGQIVLLRKV